jgi:hypothetical protein
VGDSGPQLPSEPVAFDEPGTRAAWKATRRRVVAKLWVWSVLFVAALVLSGVFAEVRWGDGARDGNSVGGLIGAPAVLAYPLALYTCRGALSRLTKARRILEAYPWQPLPAVRKLSGTKEAGGVPVQLCLPDGHERHGKSTYVDDDGSAWSESMCARDPLRWNRWDESMERGAWYAGDLGLGGVLALPGGNALMTVQRRTQVLSMERRSAGADYACILAAAPGRD